MPQYVVAEAVATLGWDDRKFLAGMKAAERAFSGLSGRMKTSFGPAQAGFTALTVTLGKFSVQATAAAKSATKLSIALRHAATQSRALNAALGGGSAAAMAANTRAAGAAAAMQARAAGAAAAARRRADGAALAAQTRAHAQTIRAHGANVSSVIRATGSAASQTIRSLAAPMNAVTRPLAAVVSSTNSMLGKLGSGGLKLGALATGAVGGLSLAEIIRESVAIEDMMVKLQRASDLSGDGLKRLGNEFKSIAATTAGVKLEDVMGIGIFGAKMGITGDRLGMFGRDVAKFSQVLDDMPAEEAATGFARLATIFDTGIEKTRNYAAALVALDQASTATGRDILDITTRMAPMMKLIGMSPQRSMALAATAREAGVQVEVAGTALAQIAARMADVKNRGAFGKLAGMSGQAFGAQLKADPSAAIASVAKGLAKMDAEHAISSLEALHLDGERTKETFLGLAQALDKLGQFTNISNEQWTKMTVIEKGAAINAGRLSAQWDKLRNGWKLTADSLGAALLPILKDVVEGLTRLMDSIRVDLEKNRGTFARWGESIGDTLSKVGVLYRNWPDFLDLAKAHVGEKFDQIAEIFRRFTVLSKHYIQIFGSDLVAYFDQIGKNLAMTIENAISRMMGQKEKFKVEPATFGDPNLSLAQRAHRAAAKEDPAGKQRWGMENFKDLPNRNLEKGRAWSAIVLGNVLSKKEGRDRQAGIEAKDQATRTLAEDRAKEAAAQRASLEGWRNPAIGRQRAAQQAARIRAEQHQAFLKRQSDAIAAKRGQGRINSLLGPVEGLATDRTGFLGNLKMPTIPAAPRTEPVAKADSEVGKKGNEIAEKQLAATHELLVAVRALGLLS